MIEFSVKRNTPMNTSVLGQIPKGDDLTRAVNELAENDQARQVKAQIQRGLDASNDPSAIRTDHTRFMAELKAELLKKADES